MPQNDATTVPRIEQDLEVAPKVMDAIMLGDLNIRLREPQDAMEKELVTELANIGLFDMTDHFMPRRRYRGAGSWTWKMRREGRQVTRRGDYILRLDRDNLVNAGVMEAILHK